MTTLAISPAQVSMIQIIVDVKLHFSTLIQYYMKMPPNVITDEKVHQVVCCFLILLVLLDTRIIVDDGEIPIHWPLLWGNSQCRGGRSWDRPELLPGVSLTEAQEFVDILYVRSQ